MILSLEDLTPSLVALSKEEREEVRNLFDKIDKQEYAEAILPMVIENHLRDYREAVGITDGMPWKQPQGAHQAVPPGHTRTFEGRLWENTSGTYLSHSPAEFPQGWTDRGEAGEGPPPLDPEDYDEWTPLTTYKKDDIRRWDGVLYLCIMDHTNHDPGHTPNLTPTLWNPIIT